MNRFESLRNHADKRSSLFLKEQRDLERQLRAAIDNGQVRDAIRITDRLSLANHRHLADGTICLLLDRDFGRGLLGVASLAMYPAIVLTTQGSTLKQVVSRKIDLIK